MAALVLYLLGLIGAVAYVTKEAPMGPREWVVVVMWPVAIGWATAAGLAASLRWKLSK